MPWTVSVVRLAVYTVKRFR
jgi:hypothetical protein